MTDHLHQLKMYPAVTMSKDAKLLTVENEKLKKLLGEKELEIEILRDIVKIISNPQFKIK